MTSYFIKTIYNSFSALVTATLILPTGDAIWLRIIGNAAGAFIVLVATALFAVLWRKVDERDNNPEENLLEEE